MFLHRTMTRALICLFRNDPDFECAGNKLWSWLLRWRPAEFSRREIDPSTAGVQCHRLGACLGGQSLLHVVGTAIVSGDDRQAPFPVRSEYELLIRIEGGRIAVVSDGNRLYDFACTQIYNCKFLVTA